MVNPRSPNQKKYVEAIEQSDMTFGIGPAGTGKTYLAVAMAASALMAKKVSRIILVRPAVEAGERLGFLPGTLQEHNLVQRIVRAYDTHQREQQLSLGLGESALDSTVPGAPPRPQVRKTQ